MAMQESLQPPGNRSRLPERLPSTAPNGLGASPTYAICRSLRNVASSHYQGHQPPR